MSPTPRGASFIRRFEASKAAVDDALIQLRTVDLFRHKAARDKLAMQLAILLELGCIAIPEGLASQTTTTNQKDN